MADGEPDISDLSPEQQEALQQYTMITDQSVQDAIPLLQRSQWNAQIAIAKFFDGEQPDPVAEALAAQERSQQAGVPGLGGTARFENLQDSLDGIEMDIVSSRRQRTEAAPRVVPQPARIYRVPILWSIITLPFSLTWRIATTLFRPIVYLLGLLPRNMRPRAIGAAGYGRRQLMPRDAAARFKREFEENYGSGELPWYDGGSAQAYDAAKRELKFLLIVLLSPEHDDTDSFVRDVLLSPEVVSFIKDEKNNIILWGGNIVDSEAYQVSFEYRCTRFPFACLVCLTPKEGSTRMGTIKRIQGAFAPERFLEDIRSAINKHNPDLDGVRAERVAQEAARNLRADQDSAYERSLAKDREKARLRREAEAAAVAAEKRALEEAEAAAQLEEKRRQWKTWRATTLAEEPPAADKDVVRLALMMPEQTGAGRIVRRFARETTLDELYAFVECYDVTKGDGEKPPLQPDDYEHEYKFRIVSPMPREVYEPSTAETVGNKIGRSGNLIVETIVSDSDDED
ncbi:hypothetical protein PspLS_08055 [Pyricularia sp. CBS 133598]|nr:hypothetical protein PspLS_08055 [Pyricularia sp. CBS 133598]